MGLTYGEIVETPIGPLSFIAGDHGLQRVAFSRLITLKQTLPGVEDEPSMMGLEVMGVLFAEFNEYFFGIRKSFSVGIDWSVMPAFQKDVLQLTYEIPYGETRTYGGLAQTLGKPGAARAVGKALAENPMPIIIPCHRMVDSTGRLRGFAAPEGIKTKAFLLNLEGHSVMGDRLGDRAQDKLF